MKFQEYIDKKHHQKESKEVRPINEFSGDEATEVDFGLFSVGGGGEIDTAVAALGAAALIAMKGMYNYAVYKWLQGKLPDYIEQYKVSQAKSSSDLFEAKWDQEKINPLKEKKRMILGTGGEREDKDVEDAAPEKSVKQMIRDEARAELAKKNVPEERKEQIRQKRDISLAKVDKQIQAISDEIKRLEDERDVVFAQKQEDFRRLDEKFEEQQEKFISVGDSLFASAWKKRWDVEFANAKGQADVDVLQEYQNLAREIASKRELSAIQDKLKRAQEAEALKKEAMDGVFSETEKAELQRASLSELGCEAYIDSLEAYNMQLSDIYKKWINIADEVGKKEPGEEDEEPVGRGKEDQIKLKLDAATQKIDKAKELLAKTKEEAKYNKIRSTLTDEMKKTIALAKEAGDEEKVKQLTGELESYKQELESKIERKEEGLGTAKEELEKSKEDRDFEKVEKLEDEIEKIEQDIKTYKQQLSKVSSTNESYQEELRYLNFHVNEAIMMLDLLMEETNTDKPKISWSITRKWISKVLSNTPDDRKEELATEAVKDTKTLSNYMSETYKKRNAMVSLIEARKAANSKAKEDGDSEDIKPLPEGASELAQLPKIKSNEIEEKLKTYEDFIQTLEKSYNAKTDVAGVKPEDEKEEDEEVDVKKLEVDPEEKDPDIIKQAKVLRKANTATMKYLEDYKPDEGEESDLKIVQDVINLRKDLAVARAAGKTEEVNAIEDEIEAKLDGAKSYDLSREYQKRVDAEDKARGKLDDLKSQKGESKKIEQVQQEVVKHKEKVLQPLENKLKTLKQEKADEKKIAAAELKVKEAKLKDLELKLKVAETKDESDETRKTIEKIEKDITAAKEDIQKAKEESLFAENPQLKTAKEDIKSKEKTVGDLQKKVSDMENSETPPSEEELNKAKEDLKNAENELGNSQKAYDKKEENARIISSSVQLRGLKKAAEEEMKKIEDLKSKGDTEGAKKAEDKLASLTQDLKKGVEDAKNEKKKAEEENESQQTKIAPKYMKFEEFLAMKNRK